MSFLGWPFTLLLWVGVFHALSSPSSPRDWEGVVIRRLAWVLGNTSWSGDTFLQVSYWYFSKLNHFEHVYMWRALQFKVIARRQPSVDSTRHAVIDRHSSEFGCPLDWEMWKCKLNCTSILVSWSRWLASWSSYSCYFELVRICLDRSCIFQIHFVWALRSGHNCLGCGQRFHCPQVFLQVSVMVRLILAG